MPLFGHKNNSKGGATVENTSDHNTKAKAEKGGESIKRTDVKADPAYAAPGQSHGSNSHNKEHLRELEQGLGTTYHQPGYSTTTGSIGTGVITGPSPAAAATSYNTGYNTGLTTGSSLPATTLGGNAGPTLNQYDANQVTYGSEGHHHHRHHKYDEQQQFQQQQYQQTEYVGGNTTTSTTDGVLTERVERQAALVEEKILRQEQEIIQPVITRDIERTEVHQISQPIHEVSVLPTQENSRVLPEQNIEKNLNKGTIAPMAIPETRRIEAEREVTQVTEQPIIQERVITKVIEEIQPVIYRDVIQPIVTVIQQPVHERIVEQAQIITETRPIIQNAPLQQQYVQQQVAYVEQPVLVQQQPLVQQQGVVHEVFHGEELGRGHLISENTAHGRHHDGLTRHDRKEMRKAEEGMSNLNLAPGQAL